MNRSSSEAGNASDPLSLASAHLRLQSGDEPTGFPSPSLDQPFSCCRPPADELARELDSGWAGLKPAQGQSDEDIPYRASRG